MTFVPRIPVPAPAFAKSAAILLTGFLHCFAPGQAVAGDTTIYAAASISHVVERLGSEYVQANDRPNGRHRFRFVTASSSTLARQIIAGASADIFISANQAWMHTVVQADRIAAKTIRPIAGNSLVLVSGPTPVDGHRTVDNHGIGTGPLVIGPAFPLGQLFENSPNDRLAIGDPAHVPVGQYARQALETLGLWDVVANRLAPMPNAPAVLNMVARHQTPYAIVYASDVRLSRDIRIIGSFPSESHDPVRYYAGRVSDSDSAVAKDFMNFLLSDQAAEVYRSYGFCQSCP